MADPITVNATRARNDFFNLLIKVHNEGKSFVIEKGKVPLARLEPMQKAATSVQATLKKGRRSAKLIREIRKKILGSVTNYNSPTQPVDEVEWEAAK